MHYEDNYEIIRRLEVDGSIDEQELLMLLDRLKRTTDALYDLSCGVENEDSYEEFFGWTRK